MTIGFELKCRDKVVTAGVEKGVTSVVVSHADGAFHLDAGGVDTETRRHLKWLSMPLEPGGGEVIIDVKRVACADEPAAIFVFDREQRPELAPEEGARQKDNRLYHYRRLEEILKAEGLI